MITLVHLIGPILSKTRTEERERGVNLHAFSNPIIAHAVVPERISFLAMLVLFVLLILFIPRILATSHKKTILLHIQNSNCESNLKKGIESNPSIKYKWIWIWYTYWFCEINFRLTRSHFGHLVAVFVTTHGDNGVIWMAVIGGGAEGGWFRVHRHRVTK